MSMILILLLPLVTGLICASVRSRRILELSNIGCFVGAALIAVRLMIEVGKKETIEAWRGFLYADALSALVVGLTAFVALVCSIYAVGYFRAEERVGRITFTQFRRYYTLTPLFVGSMFLVALAHSLGIMWAAIEATTLSSVLLIAFYNDKSSLEAAWKYIIIGSVGIALALFGTIFTYYSAIEVLGHDADKGLNWSLLMALGDRLDPAAMRLSFVLVMVGYGTKAGLAPMHTWKPDAYSEAPVPASALLGAGVINCALYGIMRFHALAMKCLGQEFSGSLLIGFGLASMVLAAPFVLVQRNFRRLIAYSSIEHAGIMAAALGFGGRWGVLGALLHMVFHAGCKPLMFFSVGNVQQHYGTPYLRKVKGALHALPWTAPLLFVATLAMTGVPPFSIFQSEFLVVSSAFQTGHAWLGGVFVASVVTIFSGFLYHMVQLNLGQQSGSADIGDRCPWKLGAMLLVMLPVVVFGFVLPSPLDQLVGQASRIILSTP